MKLFNSRELCELKNRNNKKILIKKKSLPTLPIFFLDVIGTKHFFLGLRVRPESVLSIIVYLL